MAAETRLYNVGSILEAHGAGDALVYAKDYGGRGAVLRVIDGKTIVTIDGQPSDAGGLLAWYPRVDPATVTVRATVDPDHYGLCTEADFAGSPAETGA